MVQADAEGFDAMLELKAVTRKHTCCSRTPYQCPDVLFGGPVTTGVHGPAVLPAWSMRNPSSLVELSTQVS